MLIIVVHLRRHHGAPPGASRRSATSHRRSGSARALAVVDARQTGARRDDARRWCSCSSSVSMGLFFTAVLATYTYSTPGRGVPVVLISFASAIVAVADQARRRHRASLQRQVTGRSLALMPLHAPPDQDIVIVGATGDLAQRKLIPALYNLHRQKLLPDEGRASSARRRSTGTTSVSATWPSRRSRSSRAPRCRRRAFASFAQRLQFVPLPADGNLTAVRAGDDTATDASHISRFRRRRSRRSSTASRPRGSPTARRSSSRSRSATTCNPPRSLNRTLHDVVPEQRIFRIDHYMGKETVQNLLVFRFGNSLFERIWSRDAISRVEITVAESLGVEQRGKLYEEIGAIRDIVQNHMFQVLALVAMEPPLSFDAEAIRNEKVKVLQSIQPIHPHDVVRGQYTAGHDRRREGRGVSRGAGRVADVDHGDVRGAAPAPRVVALVRRAIPAAHRQAAARRATLASSSPFTTCPLHLFKTAGRAHAASQPARRSHSAGRGHRALVRRQATGSGGHRAVRRHELQLRRFIQDVAARGVRAAAPRCARG